VIAADRRWPPASIPSSRSREGLVGDNYICCGQVDNANIRERAVGGNFPVAPEFTGVRPMTGVLVTGAFPSGCSVPALGKDAGSQTMLSTPTSAFAEIAEKETFTSPFGNHGCCKGDFESKNRGVLRDWQDRKKPPEDGFQNRGRLRDGGRHVLLVVTIFSK
jgi:hypothetical protein